MQMRRGGFIKQNGLYSPSPKMSTDKTNRKHKASLHTHTHTHTHLRDSVETLLALNYSKNNATIDQRQV